MKSAATPPPFNRAKIASDVGSVLLVGRSKYKKNCSHLIYELPGTLCMCDEMWGGGGSAVKLEDSVGLYS